MLLVDKFEVFIHEWDKSLKRAIFVLIILAGANLHMAGLRQEALGSPPFSALDTILVPLGQKVPGIRTDVRYATLNNFTGRVLYPGNMLYLRSVAADSLAAAQAELATMGFSLKVYDAYRPLSVQKLMWAILPDTNYVADPAKGSRHNRGAAVDLTIVDSTGAELDMGTGYDDFTERAHPDYANLPGEVKANRKLLSEVMQRHGFKQFPTEWWHFDFQHWEYFSILDEKY